MTTPRKVIVAVVVNATALLAALFTAVGVAAADPQDVDGGGRRGGHSEGRAGDDGGRRGCDYRYEPDGSDNPEFNGDPGRCPTQHPVENPENVEGSQPLRLPLPGTL